MTFLTVLFCFLLKIKRCTATIVEIQVSCMEIDLSHTFIRHVIFVIQFIKVKNTTLGRRSFWIGKSQIYIIPRNNKMHICVGPSEVST